MNAAAKLRAGTAGVLLLALAACSSGASSDPRATSAGDGEHAAEAPLVPATASASRAADACDTRQLTARVTRQAGETAGQTRARLILSNTGVTECSLNGWPKLALSQLGRQVELSPSLVDEPATPATVELAPGQNAFAGLRWEPCQPGTAGCSTGGQLLVAAPGSDLVQAELSGFSLAERDQLALRSIVIGPIQATGSRINDW